MDAHIGGGDFGSHPAGHHGEHHNQDNQLAWLDSTDHHSPAATSGAMTGRPGWLAAAVLLALLLVLALAVG